MHIGEALRPGLLLQSRRKAVFLAVALASVLDACSDGGSDPAETGISEGEARALDEAAEMLDEKRLPDDAIPPVEGVETSADAPVDAGTNPPDE